MSKWITLIQRHDKYPELCIELGKLGSFQATIQYDQYDQIHVGKIVHSQLYRIQMPTTMYLRVGRHVYANTCFNEKLGLWLLPNIHDYICHRESVFEYPALKDYVHDVFATPFNNDIQDWFGPDDTTLPWLRHNNIKFCDHAVLEYMETHGMPEITFPNIFWNTYSTHHTLASTKKCIMLLRRMHRRK